MPAARPCSASRTRASSKSTCPTTADLTEFSNGTREEGRYVPRQAQESSEAGQGLLRPPQEHHPHRPPGGREGHAICLSRPPREEAQFPRLVDPAHQRRG